MKFLLMMLTALSLGAFTVGCAPEKPKVAPMDKPGEDDTAKPALSTTEAPKTDEKAAAATPEAKPEDKPAEATPPADKPAETETEPKAKTE
jgi:hypothetical protein